MKVYVITLRRFDTQVTDTISVCSDWRNAYRCVIDIMSENFFPIKTNPHITYDAIVWEHKESHQHCWTYIDEYEIDEFVKSEDYGE